VNHRRLRGASSLGRLSLGASGVLLGTFSGYLAALTAVAWWARRRGAARTPLTGPPSHRFVVLVPAHDEERLIGSAVDSLVGLDYPDDLWTVHVVADNCTDATAPIARAHGAEVHERHDPEHGGKGPALAWVLARLHDRGECFDAVAVIDADTSVSQNFLQVMDAKLAEGAQAVQAYYAVRDAEDSPVAAFRSAALAARHYLRPLARTAVGGSAGLYGNGMVFRPEVFARHQWTNHLTEDIELQLELLLEGESVAFAPDAIVEAEMPTTVGDSRSQHERWERGRLEMAQRYVPRLVRRAVSARGRERLAAADAVVDQLVPPFSVLVAGTAVWSAAVGLRALVARRGRRWPVVAAGAIVAAQGWYVVSSLRMVSAPKAVYRSLLGAPRLVVWKVGLWLRMIVRPRDVAWVRTARNVATDAPAPAAPPVPA
jgi:hypothetical protein